jgi:hypothetical protein
MNSKTKPKSQSEKFKEAARQVEADDDEAAFDHKLRKIAKNSQSPRNDNDHKN